MMCTRRIVEAELFLTLAMMVVPALQVPDGEVAPVFATCPKVLQNSIREYYIGECDIDGANNLDDLDLVIRPQPLWDGKPAIIPIRNSALTSNTPVVIAPSSTIVNAVGFKIDQKVNYVESFHPKIRSSAMKIPTELEHLQILFAIPLLYTVQKKVHDLILCSVCKYDTHDCGPGPDIEDGLLKCWLYSNSGENMFRVLFTEDISHKILSQL